MSELYLRNRQRARPIDRRLLNRIASALLAAIAPPNYQFGVVLVSQNAMARLNESFLGHQGATDVITFSYASAPGTLHGEVFICVNVAMEQARRFGTCWQLELVRYLVHGLLHCLGYDDASSEQRAEMKKLEDKVLHRLERQFPIRSLGRETKRGAAH